MSTPKTTTRPAPGKKDEKPGKGAKSGEGHWVTVKGEGEGGVRHLFLKGTRGHETASQKAANKRTLAQGRGTPERAQKAAAIKGLHKSKVGYSRLKSEGHKELKGAATHPKGPHSKQAGQTNIEHGSKRMAETHAEMRRVSGKPSKRQAYNPPDKPTGRHEVKVEGDLAKHYETAFRAAHEVHGDLGLPKIQLKATAPNVKDAGRFNHSTYSSDSIEINPDARHPAFVAVHEHGHFVDREAFMTFGTGFASEEGGRSAKVMSAIMKTKETKELLRSAKSFKGQAGDHAKYLADPKEIFARAYSQHIATKTKHPDLMAGLTSDRGGNFGKMAHWSDTSFKAISKEFDALFASKSP